MKPGRGSGRALQSRWEVDRGRKAWGVGEAFFLSMEAVVCAGMVPPTCRRNTALRADRLLSSPPLPPDECAKDRRIMVTGVCCGYSGDGHESRKQNAW